MARQRRAPALKALRPHEAREILEALLKAHPDLISEAERIAAGILDDITWESVRSSAATARRSMASRTYRQAVATPISNPPATRV